MTIFHKIDRDAFLSPFDKVYDQMMEAHFPEVVNQVGVNPMQGTEIGRAHV